MPVLQNEMPSLIANIVLIRTVSEKLENKGYGMCL